MASVYSHSIVPGTVDRLIVHGVDHLTRADFVSAQDPPYILQGTDGNDHIAGNLLDNTIYGGATTTRFCFGLPRRIPMAPGSSS